MNRAFYIAGIVLSFIFLIVCGYFISEVQSARMDYYFSMIESDYYYAMDSSRISALTFEAGLISLFFFLAFITIDLLGLIKVKTTTMKVMGIIGLAISGLYLIWDFMVLASPGSLSFDEVGGGFGFYCFIMLAFSIVGLVQSVRFAKKQEKGAPVSSINEKDLLDS